MMKNMLIMVATLAAFNGLYSQNREIGYDQESGLMYKKTYIDSDRIVIRDNQMFLNLYTQLMGIQSLFSDMYGMFLRMPIIDSYWTCICGWEYSDKDTTCENPRCVLYKR